MTIHGIYQPAHGIPHPRAEQILRCNPVDRAAPSGQNDHALFLQLHKPPVLIDEVQYAPELFTHIKIHIDEHHNPSDFWLTGSQIFRLMRGVQESLAGRVALLHMTPLSQWEIIGAPCAPFTTDLDRLLAEQDQMS